MGVTIRRAGPRERDVWETETGRGDVVRLRLVAYLGKQYIDLRRWWRDGETGELKPTSKGIRIHAEMAGPLGAALLAVENGDYDHRGD